MTHPLRLIILLSVFLSATSSAQPTYWPISSGGNGHGYEVVTTQMSWADAQSFAESQGGYLATITSPDEQFFIESFVVPDPPVAFNAFKLGGYQDIASGSASEPNGGWRWVTGEDWQHTNWSPGEPSDCCPTGEDFLTLHRVESGGLEYSWNDNVSLNHLPFIIEYDTNPAPVTTLNFDSAPVGPIDPFDEGGYSIRTELNLNPTYNNAILNVGGANQNVVTDATPENAFGTRMIITRTDGGSFTVESFAAANLAAPASPVSISTTSCAPGGFRMELDSQPGGACHGYVPGSSTLQSISIGDFIEVSELNVRLVSNLSLDFAVDNFRLIRTSPECSQVGALAPSTPTIAPGEYHHCENWSSASLAAADLSNCVLSRSNLESALLSGANLSNATLSGANLSSTDLTSANLVFADLTGAIYDETTVFPSGNAYDSPPSGLDQNVTPWEARMIPVPEPGVPATFLISSAASLVLWAGYSRESSKRE